MRALIYLFVPFWFTLLGMTVSVFNQQQSLVPTVHACMLSRFSRVWLFVITPLPPTMDCSSPAALSMGFPRQEYWSGLQVLLQMTQLHFFFYGWGILHCLHAPHLLYCFLSPRTFKLFQCPGYCKYYCCEHWGWVSTRNCKCSMAT